MLLGLTLIVLLGTSLVGAYEFVQNDPLSVPSVVIAGVSKGGTTDLYFELTDVLNHTLIAAKDKEPRHLKYMPADDVWTSDNFWDYLDMLNHPCAHAAHSHSSFTSCAETNVKLTIDASPRYYMFTHVAKHLKAFSPSSKVIILIREPLSRAISLYKMRRPDTSIRDMAHSFLSWVRKEDVALNLTKMMETGDDETRECYFHALMDGGLIDGNNNIFGMGLYAYPLQSWHYHHMHPDRTLIVDSHLYFTDRIAVFAAVTEFVLGRHPTQNEMDLAEQHAIRGSKSSRGGTTGLNPNAELPRELHTSLVEFFRPHNGRLLSFLDQLRKEGYQVMGFDTEPWLSNSTYAVDS